MFQNFPCKVFSFSNDSFRDEQVKYKRLNVHPLTTRISVTYDSIEDSPNFWQAHILTTRSCDTKSEFSESFLTSLL